jgi:hypothetical protein
MAIHDVIGQTKDNGKNIQTAESLHWSLANRSANSF